MYVQAPQGGTVKDAVHVAFASQELVTVKVTVLVSPHVGDPTLLFDTKVLHPPVTLTEASHAAYNASICAWVCPGAMVVLAGQVRTTGGALVTVKLALQVTGD